jgi:CRISPR system Cascade subunit CasE
MSSESLYLLHTRPDPQRLAAWAARHRLLDSQGDLGYALHALLHAAFGTDAPQPFRYVDAEQGLLAYSQMSAAELTQRAALADQDVAAALGLTHTLHSPGLSVRPFPTTWASGHELGFEVRSRPVIREGKSGRERDAFLAAIEKVPGVEMDRSVVYVQWLREVLARQGGAELIGANVMRYQLLGVARRTQRQGEAAARQSRSVTGPDVVFSGQLCVKDSQAFSQLITKGIGRHRAFGFGLVMLRSARAG